MKNLNQLKKKKHFLALLFILLIAFLLFFIFRHSGVSSKDLNTVKAEVGNLMILPKDEDPTLATVEDRAKLKDNFLALHAQNGDKVLIYTKNQTVIIYRPSINKIAAVGSVQVDQSLAEANGATLTILNGSNNQQKVQDIITKIRASYPTIQITDGGKTTRQDFPDTLVIDNTNAKDNLSESLTKILSAKHGIVPLGVEKSPTDLMILVGQN